MNNEFNNIRKLEVWLHDRKVGTLAQMKNGLAAFEYDSDWLKNGFSISPFSLPLQKGVFIPKSYYPFEGLFGVFADSLPDGWGRLVTDRWLLERNIDPYTVTALSRLAIVGESGKGALTYKPVFEIQNEMEKMELDELARECARLFDDDSSEYVDQLLEAGGSSGGARPKANIDIDHEKWIVKFPSKTLHEKDGRMEYDYSLCARKLGIDMPETRLLKSEICSGFFAIKRFDQQPGWKKHMISLSGLLETSHQIPNLDYEIIFKVVMKLTHDFSQMEKLFRLMCFNVLAHNRDDHSKNFSFLYDEKTSQWELSPAYDLTWSNSIGGEHATTVMGNGRNPGRKELLEAGKLAGLKREKVLGIIELTEKTVQEMLGQYL